MPNFTDWSGCVKITSENEAHLRSSYEARRENELPVLTRYFDASHMELKPSGFLDIILYSKEQISKENKATGVEDVHGELDYDYGIVSINPQDVDYECPMNPITMMRNSMISEGGSGVALVRENYMESVKFWSEHATLK